MIMKALGTESGKLFLLDCNGNLVRQFAPHTARINDIVMDKNEEFVGTASDDGKKSPKVYKIPMIVTV